MIKFALIFLLFKLSIYPQEKKQIKLNPESKKENKVKPVVNNVKEIPIQKNPEDSKKIPLEVKSIEPIENEVIKHEENTKQNSKSELENSNEVDLNIKRQQESISKQAIPMPVQEKKYSAQFVLGSGVGHLNIQHDRYNPNSSLSEFVALSLVGATIASPSYANILSSNLGTNALFSLFLLNDELTSNKINSASNSSFNRFYIENREQNDSVGIRFGLSSGSYNFKADASRFETAFLSTSFFGNSNPIVNMYMIQSYNQVSKPIYLAINTFDVALNFHFNPDEKFDPYLGFGAGIGSCFVDCYAFRAFGRAGIRYNFPDYYAFLEQEMQLVLFSSKFNYYEPMQERITILGFGFYL